MVIIRRRALGPEQFTKPLRKLLAEHQPVQDFIPKAPALIEIGMHIAGHDEGIVNPAAGGRAGIGFWAPLRTQRRQHTARRRTVHAPSKEIAGATLRRCRIVACTPGAAGLFAPFVLLVLRREVFSTRAGIGFWPRRIRKHHNAREPRNTYTCFYLLRVPVVARANRPRYSECNPSFRFASFPLPTMSRSAGNQLPYTP